MQLIVYCSMLRLTTRGQLTVPIYQNHNNLWDNGGHGLMITRQMTTKASNETTTSTLYQT